MTKKNKYIDKFVIIILIVLMSGASLLNDYSISLVVILFIFIILAAIRKVKLNRVLFILLISWIVINVLSAFVNSAPFSIDTFLGYSIRICISFLAIKIVGAAFFWKQFENFIYKLVLISLPLFVLNFINPDFFNSLKPIFEPITGSDFYRKESQSMYWYAFFYTNSGREEIRNCGFMWEPGAYSMVLIIAIVYNWVRVKMIINKRIIFYVIALFTTFSTAGYLAFSILLLAYTIKTKKAYLIGVAILILIPINIYVNSVDSVVTKVDSYLEEFDSNTAYEQGFANRYEVNRFIYFFMSIKKATNYPFGYGVLEDEESYSSRIKIVGVNGLGDILLMWGWLGLLFVIYAVYKFCSSPVNSTIITLCLALSILITFFSNPIESNPILFLVVFTPFINRKLYQKNE